MKSKKSLEDQFGKHPKFEIKPQYTPTPWQVVNAMDIATTSDRLFLMSADNERDAAFIVRAVNALGLLLEVCHQVEADLGDCSCSDHKCLFCLAQEAIAKAEGK